jgi:NTE family protein
MAARRPINVALQGGGAHGAFTWGVLDYLLEDDRIDIEGISGTSAGAMNGAMLAQGWIEGGAAGARAALDRFWDMMSRYAPLALVHRTPWDRAIGNWNLDRSVGYAALELMMRIASPYQLNPLNWHPLRDVLGEVFDIDKVRACTQIKLFVSATNVATGKIRIFENKDISLDALIASGCLPFLFQAPIIDGEPYWDGGYMGNPALFPLIYGCASSDILIVEINPLTREGVPATATEINNRVNEIGMNSSLMREARAIHFVRRLKREPNAGAMLRGMKDVNLHMIAAGERMIELGISSKFNVDRDFLLYLKALGRDAASEWVEQNFAAIGERSSVDVEKVFL